MLKVIVTAIHRVSGRTIGPLEYSPNRIEYALHKAASLRSRDFFVVINDPYNERREEDPSLECASEISGGINAHLPLVKFPYKVHSINTVNQQRQGSHVGFVETLGEAIDRATGCVKNWSPHHKSVVIFKAVKLVRSHASPIEIIDL